MKPVEIFHLGPPKTATTWLYNNLRTHPDILTSPRDSIHYFDIHYHLGQDWYASQFETSGRENRKLFDPTYSYICCERAPKRIYKENPSAKLMFSLRHPADRAFSHYWHMKKTGQLTFPFSDILNHYDFFCLWLGFGLLGQRVEELLELFSREQLHPIMYDDISTRPRETFRSVLQFCGIDEFHLPDALEAKVNVAGSRRFLPQRAAGKIGRILGMGDTPVFAALSGKSEYLRGPDAETYNRILAASIADIEHLEKLLSLDLSHWKVERKAGG